MAIEVHGLCALLSVYDMPAALAFYRDLLGFKLVARSPAYEVIDGVEHFHWCTLQRGSDTLMLNTEYDTGERPPQRPPFQQQPFGVWFYFACPDLDAAYRTLVAAGVHCEPPRLVRYGGRFPFRVLSLRDPDGHGITLQWPAEQSDTLSAKE